jgi:predicted ATPase
VIALCAEKGIPFWQTVASINHGYALTSQGCLGEGIAEASQALAIYRAIGANVLQTLYLTLLAGMHLMAGQVDAGLVVVDEGLAAVAETDEHIVEAELHRLRAELLSRQAREAEAEADLCQALAIAQGQQARMWQLRATVSLCRLWRKQGKPAEAHRILAEIYGWFTEGFDTPDLVEARALLTELG